MRIVKNRLGTAEKDSAAPGLFYFALFVLSVPGGARGKPPISGVAPCHGRFQIYRKQ